MARAVAGIAFDLDGVFWRVPNVFPWSKSTVMKCIDRKIPFVFLTNGGGYPEAKKMKEINNRLKLDIDLDHFRLILCHSPLREHLQHLQNEQILVTGNSVIHDVAKEYGLNKAVTTGEVVTAHPNVWPYECGNKLLSLDDSRKNDPNLVEYDPTLISAVAIFNEPFDWGSELQVTMDALMYGRKMNGNDHPLFYYTNADTQWNTSYRFMRFGQGIYAGTVMDTYQRLTGKTLNAVQFGKPMKATYDYAEKVLMAEAAKLGYEGIEEVYMIGDNPSGDIVGGNNKGWNTILLKTGVYQDGMESENPTTIQENVQDGVEWICARHGL